MLSFLKRNWDCLLLVALVVLIVLSKLPKPEPEVEKLINELYDPANKTTVGIHVIPGGEILTFSPPMKKLIALGEEARVALHERVPDQRIQNEVVVVLGAIGNESTVPLLIDAYPEIDLSGELDNDDPGRLKIICFTYALTYLAGEPIGRSRWGTDAKPGNRKLWQDWWAKHQKTFNVLVDKPNATWVPSYPAPSATRRNKS